MSLGDSILDVVGDIYDVTPAGFVMNKVTGAVLGPTVLSASDQAADIDAIHDFFVREQPVNAKAERIKDDWMRWAGGLSWYEKHVDTNIGAEAFNRRNEFMRANVQSKEELDKTNEFLKKVPAFNPVTGNPNFVDSKGDRIKQPEPLIPTPYKVAGVIGAAAIAALVVLKKLTIL
jgi:hypothetical protein